MKQLGFTLGGAIRNFQQARRTKQQAEAETLERLAIRAGLNPATAATLALNLVTTPRLEQEPFIMMTASQNAAVVRWLRQHSESAHKRPSPCGPNCSRQFTPPPGKSCSHGRSWLNV